MDRQKRFWLWLEVALLIGISLLFRCQHIRADTPRLLADISGSAGEFFDEGIYCHNARNKILYGRWITDEWNPLVYNAPLTGLYWVTFRLFGVTMAGVKGLNIFFGCLGILLFYSLVSRWFTRLQAWCLALIFALDYYWIMYNRLGLLENFSALAFLASLYLFDLGRRRDWIFLFSGMAVAVAVLSKYLYVFFLAAALLAVIHHCWQRRKVVPLVWFAAGFASLLGLWLVFIYLPFAHNFGKIGSSWGALALPRNFSQIARNLLHQPWFRFMLLTPLLGLAQVFFLASFLARTIRGRLRQADSLELFVFLWLAGGICTLGALNYSPMRYHLPLVPAAFLALALWLHGRDSRPRAGLLFWPFAALLGLFFLPFFRGLVPPAPKFFVFPLPLRLLVYAGIAVLFAALLWLRWMPRAKAVLALTCISLALSLFLYAGHFYSRPTYNLEIASETIRSLPQGSLIMGQEAPRLALETRFPTLMAYEGWFNDENPFQRYRPSHLLVMNKFGEFSWIQRRFPDVAATLKPLRKFYFWDTSLTLFKVKGIE